MALLIALITALSVPAPLESSTRRLSSLAFGAIPMKVLIYPDPADFVPLPATMPATWVPCPYPSAVPVCLGTKLWLYTIRDEGFVYNQSFVPKQTGTADG